MTDIVERIRRMATIQFAQHDHDAIKEAADEIERLQTRVAELEQENARLIEDRARFPDRPGDIGRMIGAHIGNLKSAKSSSDKYAAKYRDERDAAQRRIAELEAQRVPGRIALLSDVPIYVQEESMGSVRAAYRAGWNDCREATRTVAPQLGAVPEYNGWYCAQCERGVDPTEVTFNEAHTECGRIITNDRPPTLAATGGRDGLLGALSDAAQSLETISQQAGRDEFMDDMGDVRAYANSRARVAREALAAAQPAQEQKP